MTPEQIQDQGGQNAEAGLVDQWGRLHRVGAAAEIGRNINADGVAVLHASVSRRHASIMLDGLDYLLKDLGSANGTYLQEMVVGDAVKLGYGSRIRFGQIAFFFVSNIAHAALPRPRRAISVTPEIILGKTTLRLPALRDLETKTFGLQQPTGGGGGLLEVDGKSVQLTTPQFELVEILIERMLGDHEMHHDIRGFVSTPQLVTQLSLESVEPGGDNIRQLVRRFRRLLDKAGIPDIIETRHGFGYRLRVIPRVERNAKR